MNALTDLNALKTRQQAAWASGDYAVIGTTLQIVGQVFKTLGRHLPAPAGLQPPSRWGVEANLHTLFGEAASAISVTPRVFNFRYRSAAHFIEVFRTWYGPIHKTFAALPADGALALERDLTELLSRMNRAGNASLVVPSEYLEVVVTHR